MNEPRSDRQHFTAHGTVTGSNGKAIDGAEVTLYWQRLRRRIELATARSGDDGRYHLHYRLPDDAPARALVVARASGRGLGTPIESAATLAASRLELDLAAPLDDPSSYGALLRSLAPLLGGLSLLDLVESDEHQDVTLLAAETGRSKEEIARVVVAARAERGFAIPAAAFYAFLAAHVPSSLPASLLQASQRFTLIDAVVEKVVALVASLDPDLQSRTLQDAVARRVVGPPVADAVASVVDALQALRRSTILSSPYLAGKTTLAQMLDTAALAKEKQTAFAQALAENDQRLDRFWTELAGGQHGFTPDEVAAVRQTLSIGAFVKNALPLVTAVRRGFAAGKYKVLPDLARLTEQDWLDLVHQSGPGAVPANIAGTDPAATFAREIYDRVTTAYPTAALSARVQRFVPQAQQAPLSTFFTNNASLDLRRENLAAHLAQAGDAAFVGIADADRPGVVANVRAMQRVLRIAPHVDVCELLLKLGLGSASAIAAAGRLQFVALVEGAGGTKLDALKTYGLARARHAGVLALYAELNRNLNGLWPKALGPQLPDQSTIDAATAQSATLSVLFGSQDYCAVDDCTSILSPAAYLTDLLRWLSRRTAGVTGYPSAFAAFDARRPDVANLLLDCANTDTPLPYVDIVNELLGDAIAPPNPPVWRQTTLSASELRAAPDPSNLNAAADAKVRAAAYPHGLPYDAALDQLRTVLQQSNVPLWQVREAFLPLHGAPPPSQLATVASELFGICAAERALITTPSSVPSSAAWGTPTPLTDLTHVDAFLAAADLRYEQLLELVEVAWARGGGPALSITLTDGADDCDASKQTLGPLDDPRLDRLHRFLRLWRRTGWKMWELDLLLSNPVIGDPTLSADTLVRLHWVRRLQDVAKLSVVEVLAFFGPIDSAAHLEPDGSTSTPLYATLFVNPALTRDPSLAPPQLDGTADLDTHAPAIQAALQVSATDASALVAMTDNHRTIENVSLTYRIARLAGALGLSLAELRALGPATLTDVFASPDVTFGFVQRAARTAGAGFTVDALQYVLTTTAPTKTGVTDAGVRDVLDAVTSAIAKTRSAVYGGADPAFTVLARQFALLPASADPAKPGLSDPAQAKIALSIVDGSFAGGDPARTTFIQSQFAAFMSAAEVANSVAALTPLPQAATGAALDARAEIVLAPLVRFSTETGVVAALAHTLSLAADLTSYLTRRLDVPSGTATLLAALTEAQLVTSPIPPAALSAAENAIRLLHKIGVVVARLHLVLADAQWLVEHVADYGGLNLAALPVLGGQPAQPVDSLLTTVLLVQLNRAFTARKDSTATPAPAIADLMDLVGAVAAGTVGSDADAQRELAGITGTTPEDVAALANALGVSLAAGDWKAPATYDRFRRLLAIQRATSGSGAALATWGVEAPDEGPAAASALLALKSRFAPDAWLAQAATLNDPLRERRRDAYAAYLTGQRQGGQPMPWGTDGNGLFDYFLIDSQMSSCMQTSRVVQAYSAVQLFVERALMNLEPSVPANAALDEGWSDWTWMRRYRLWQADREIFLWPENWLIEATRPDGSELFQKLIQGARQANATADELESVVLDYVDGLDQIAHLRVTGMCQDPTSQTTHVIARTHADPPRYYHRTYDGSSWTPWTHVPLGIKAHHVVPAVHRRTLYLFWPDVTLATEPQQQVPPAQATTSPSKSGPAARHVEIGLGFTFRRNDQWVPMQSAGGKFYDIPLLLNDLQARATTQTVEKLYTVKVNLPATNARSDIWVDIHRNGPIDALTVGFLAFALEAQQQQGNYDTLRGNYPENKAPHLARAVFDGRFNTLALRDFTVIVNGSIVSSGLNQPYLTYAQTIYGAEAERLVGLDDEAANPDLLGDSGLLPKGGSLVTPAIAPGSPTSLPLHFAASFGPNQQNAGTLLGAARAPFAIVGPSTDLQFHADNDFVYTDDKRAYYVRASRWYQYGSLWRPIVPSNPADAPFELHYDFLRFYHPYTKLFWHEIFNGGLSALYSPQLQSQPWSVDPANGDAFSFQATYQPTPGRVSWGEDGEIIDFDRGAAYGSYNWELFFHVPLYVAQTLKDNAQFEDALSWLEYVFNPTAPGPLPPPQRFWVTAPLAVYNTAQAAQQRINNILALVHENDGSAVAAVASWEANPFNPFAVAELRPVAYMKATVKAYVETLIAYADSLFASGSRENLTQATLLLVRASEILGPRPQAVPPPPPAYASYNQLAAQGLDDFANAMVEIENVLPYGGASSSGTGPLPPLHAFYFKIPPNDRFLSLWDTIDDRLFKLRHCLSLSGQPMQLPLFDSPLDPGLLAAAEAGGADVMSVFLNASSPLPNYRYDVLYAQAQTFCAAVRAFGQQFLTALEKSDADALALLLPQLQRSLLAQESDLYQAQVDEANAQIQALEKAKALQAARNAFYTDHATRLLNDHEQQSIDLTKQIMTLYAGIAGVEGLCAIVVDLPDFLVGMAGFGGSPATNLGDGGTKAAASVKAGGNVMHALAQIADRQVSLTRTLGGYYQRQDLWSQQAKEAQITSDQIDQQLDAANAHLTVRQQQQIAWQNGLDNLQQQIDFLQGKFTNEQLYDWMAGTLSSAYQQAFGLAFAMARRAERCFQYELARPSATFIQFGHWDSLRQGLLAGELLMGDLLRMHAAYLDLNVRRYEISRVFSLSKLAPEALIQLLQTGACDFGIPESVFDTDYPGHYQRQIRRVSLTVVYPSPGKNDNVSCTLTLVANQVRMTTALKTGAPDPYAESPKGGDGRFAYQYGAVETIVLSQAQDDPGLFENQIHYQITDPRYLPFEGAGAISTWHLELPSTNQIDVTAVGDVLIHVLYTSLDGGPELKAAAVSSLASTPQVLVASFSAANDFASAWTSFLTPPASGNQVLTLPVTAARFPSWTRGKRISVTSVTAYAASWGGASFVLVPQKGPFASTPVTLSPLPGTPALLASAALPLQPSATPGTWAFELQVTGAADFRSLTSADVSDVILQVAFTAQ